MTTPVLNLHPESDGYSVGKPDNIRAVKTEGGLSRRRKRATGVPRPVSVEFRLDPAKYDYWENFLADAIDEGTLPFFLNLIVAGSGLQQCLCTLDSYSLAEQRGLTYVVRCDLEVQVGSIVSPPPVPLVLPVPSPVTSDELPVYVQTDWTAETVQLFLDGVQVASVPAIDRLGSFALGVLADGVHTITAKASNAAGQSAESGPVSFYSGTAAAAASYTLDGAETFES